jgi:osmotically-inducible protein OsmY
MGQTAQPHTTNSDQKDVDNTAINKRDASGETVTPDEQASGSRSDVEVTRRIRQLITRDESLSTAAKNVKIITQNGNVTLRGVVNSVEESDKIQKAAKQVAGSGAVTNALDVKRR